jgi:hypothetical protein
VDRYVAPVDRNGINSQVTDYPPKPSSHFAPVSKGGLGEQCVVLIDRNGITNELELHSFTQNGIGSAIARCKH